MSIPSFLAEALNTEYGKDAEKILRGYSCERVVSLRVNALKTDAAAVRARLRDWRAVSWYGDALIAQHTTESELRKTSLYENGEIYLQSLSSMLPPLVLDAKEGESVLDMTAAPGGKTTQISALSGGKALITACEKDKIRFERLRYNVEKQGARRVTLLQTDALKLDEFFRFDKILLDAPCSGSGTLDLRYPVKISEKLVENSVALQKRLLAKALRLLKKGGTMVYSTCSVLSCENGSVLESVLPAAGAETVPIRTEAFPGLPLLPSPDGTLCVCPNEEYEGFFVAKIRKP